MLSATLVCAWAHADDTVRIDCPAVSEDAQRLRQQSKYREARERFHACADPACPAVVRKDCAQWQADLDQTMPTIVVAGLDENDRDVIDAELAVDGVIVATHLDGKPLPMNPGAHELRVTASQRYPVTLPVVVREGEKNRVVRLKFASKAVAARPTEESTPAPRSPQPGGAQYSKSPPAGAVVVGALGLTMMVASVPVFAAEDMAPVGAMVLGLGFGLATTGAVWWGVKANTPIAPSTVSWRLTGAPLPGGGYAAVHARW